MKHTKGEWTIHHKEHFESFMISSDASKKVDGKSLFVAKLKYEEPWQDKFISNLGRSESECRRRKSEAEANARLIAAAPKMLDHLIYIAAREGWQYLFDLIEEITGQEWSYQDAVNYKAKLEEEYKKQHHNG